MIGLFNIAGTLTSGYLAQKFSKKLILSSIYLARGLVIAIFIFLPPSPIIAVLFGITFGFLWLSTVPPTMGLVGFIFGTKYIGLLYGIVFLSHQIGSFLGAYLGGVFHDLYGSYDYAWYISIALSIFAGFSLTVVIHFSSFKSEGSPFERIFPFVVAYILVQLGRRKELS